MRLKKGKGKNFEDRTSPEQQGRHFPTEKARMNAHGLEINSELGQIRYRRKKQEGTRDFWEKRGLRK